MVRLKVQLRAYNMSGITFQFQDGTIKRLRPVRSKHIETRFNSKMVRLKDAAYATYAADAAVSIPRWYD